MIRTTLAAFGLAALLTSACLAGDCNSCGAGGHAGPAWDGYCGGGSCNTCCPKPCFPILHCALHKVGRVVDALLPDPCCRRGTGCFCGGSMGCAAPASPGCCSAAAAPGNDPFIDDQAPPSPIPMRDARARSPWATPKTGALPAPPSHTVASPARPAPKMVAKSMPVKMATLPKAKTSKPSVQTKSKSVLKVAYEDDAIESHDEVDAPPAMPASIREVQTEVAESDVRVTTAKPVFRTRALDTDLPVNPLR